jgi:hypothetical protein
MLELIIKLEVIFLLNFGRITRLTFARHFLVCSLWAAKHGFTNSFQDITALNYIK